MKAYPVVCFKDDDSDFGFMVPDMPGCVSAGETFELAYLSIVEAIEMHIQGMLEDDEPIPEPSEGRDLLEEYSDATGVMLVPVDVDRLGKMERLNVTMPKYLISRIDAVTGNRSEWLRDLAEKELKQA